MSNWKCGVDFCEYCGDCLHCYEGDKCYKSDDGEHCYPMDRKTLFQRALAQKILEDIRTDTSIITKVKK